MGYFPARHLLADNDTNQQQQDKLYRVKTAVKDPEPSAVIPYLPVVKCNRNNSGKCSRKIML